MSSSPRPRTSSSASTRRASRSSSGSTPRTCTSAPTPKPESRGQSGRWQSEYHDVMIDHDKHVGELLDLLDELGIADNTFVMYSTDNGPHMNSWPDAAMTPFRNEKNSNWEGAYRVPAMVRWPGKIKPGSVSNEIVSHMDWLPTFLAMAGEPDIKEKLKKGHKAGNKTFKVHLDGYNLLPYLTGQEKKSPRMEYLLLLRRRRSHGACATTTGSSCSWSSAPPAPCGSGRSRSCRLRVPKIFNLRTDPYERADITSNTYYDWFLDHVYLLVPAQAAVGEFLADVQGVPTAAEGGELHGRPGDGETHRTGARCGMIGPLSSLAGRRIPEEARSPQRREGRPSSEKLCRGCGEKASLGGEGPLRTSCLSGRNKSEDSLTQRPRRMVILEKCTERKKL